MTINNSSRPDATVRHLSATKPIRHQRRKKNLRAHLFAVVPLLITASAVLLSPQTVRGQTAVTSEQKVKVAYLYNFVRYVHWPEQAFKDKSSPFVIGVLSGDPHARLLERVAAKKLAKGRHIVIRQFRSVEEIKNCHLVFIFAGSGPSAEAAAIAATEKTNALLVCDDVQAPRPGATIRFFRDHDGTIGLQINIDAMVRRELKADAKLLNIASVVRG